MLWVVAVIIREQLATDLCARARRPVAGIARPTPRRRRRRNRRRGSATRRGGAGLRQTRARGIGGQPRADRRSPESGRRRPAPTGATDSAAAPRWPPIALWRDRPRRAPLRQAR